MNIKKIILGILALGFVSGIIAVSFVVWFFYKTSQDLPETAKIANFNPPQATVVLARDGTALGSLFYEKRFTVPLHLMSEHIPKAFLAAEDDSFYQHKGIDPIAIVRAAITNFKSGKTVQGGSTITQQVIKQLLLTPERSYTRKAKEAILAYRLEKQLSKDEILTIYLNQIFLGQQAYGIEAAARTFFGKHATDITLAESALLAGMPQAPSRYNPFRYPEAAKSRQMYVLRRLQELKWITDEEYEQAVNEPLVYWTMPETPGGASSWYLEEVRRLLISFFNEETLTSLGLPTDKVGEDFVYQSGLTVTTAMDPIHQQAAADGLRSGLESLTKRQGWRGPINNLPPEQRETYLNKSKFTPYELVGGAWTQALVTKVEKNGADVILGNNYIGRVNVSTMSWGRKPNPKVIAMYAPAINDATKVLKEGDIIWVSAPDSVERTVKEKGKDVLKEATYDAGAVTTTQPISLALQQVPEVQGAVVSIEPSTGDVVALIGGYQFGTSHFNRAVQSQRQPGSAFKPFVYSAALDLGFTASSTLLDAPFVYINPYTNKVWEPTNYTKEFKGPVKLSTALAQSLNTCTVRLAQQIGIPAVIERAKALGFEPEFPNELSVSLGAVAVSPMNLTQAYTAFAYQGWSVRPRIITSIKDAQGKILYEQNPEHWQALSEQNAYIMATLLKKVVTSGTAKKALSLQKPMGGKTGTTNEERDAWFVGFTPHLVTGVYIGYDQLRSLGRNETGGYTALPAYINYRKKVEYLYPADDFVMPSGILMIDDLAYKSDEPITGTALIEENNHIQEQGEDLLRQLY